KHDQPEIALFKLLIRQPHVNELVYMWFYLFLKLALHCVSIYSDFCTVPSNHFRFVWKVRTRRMKGGIWTSIHNRIINTNSNLFGVYRFSNRSFRLKDAYALHYFLHLIYILIL